MGVGSVSLPAAVMAPVLGLNIPPYLTNYRAHQAGLPVANTTEATLYLAVVMVFYVAVVLILVGVSLASGSFCSRDKYKKPESSKTVVEFYEGECVSNRVMTADEDEDREEVVLV